jgi:osmotically-inducible protein OsmY
MSHDLQLEETVHTALANDPRLQDEVIAVSARAGNVTLRGTVSSIKHRRTAVQTARSVRGAEHVLDLLELRPPPGDARDDKLRGVALQLLISDPRVPEDNVDVKVSAAWLTLSGQVKRQEESDAAFEDVFSMDGVGGITNEIKVVAAH